MTSPFVLFSLAFDFYDYCPALRPGTWSWLLLHRVRFFDIFLLFINASLLLFLFTQPKEISPAMPAMTDAIDTLLLAADKKSEDQPMAIGQPFSSAAADQGAPQPQHTRSEQPEHPAPEGKHTRPSMPVPSTNKPTDATKKDTPALTAPMLPIPTERHLPSYKKPNAALTFPEKVSTFPLGSVGPPLASNGARKQRRKKAQSSSIAFIMTENKQLAFRTPRATCCSRHKC